MNLVPLFEEALEFQNYNGTVLSNGKVAVYYIGRTRLADIYNDVAAEYPAENPRILDNLGMGPVYVSPAFDYELVVFDAYDNELFSVKKYLHSKGEHSTANVVVTPSENIAVSAWTVGDVQVYMPYLTGQLGKIYEGISPIVVNNVEDKISAQHVPLGVQDPLYFVQDDEEGCIIGFSGQTVPEGVMTESALGFEDNKITGYNGSAFSTGNEYEAGSYVDITDNTISVTGLQPEGDYAYNSALSSKLDVTATGQFLTGLPEDLVYSADITGLATTAQLDEKLDKADSANFYPMESNPSGYITAHQSLAGYATEQWVEDKGYLTSVDIPESAVWNATTQTVSANSAQWAGGTANPQIPVTSTSGISIFESGDKVYFNISADYAFTADLTGKQDSLTFGYKDTAISSIDNSAIYDNSAHARITTLAGRITDLSSNKQDVSGMTAYQPTMTFGYDENNAISSINESALAGTTYSAGSGIDITDDVISVDNTIARTADLPNIFIAVYNSTPFSALQEAFAAGKMILCKDSDTSPRVFTTNSVSLYQGELSTIRFAGSLNVSTDRIIDSNTIIRQYSCFTGGWRKYTVTAYSALQSDWNQTGVTNIGYIKNKPDLTQYQTTAGMTAYQEAGDYYSASNPSGFISEVPAGTMNESAFGYDASDNITAYNGSAFKAGDEFPQSATEAIETVTANSADWNGTTDTVSSNSGAWGGSALPISAGAGISLSMVNGVLVISTAGGN